MVFLVQTHDGRSELRRAKAWKRIIAGRAQRIIWGRLIPMEGVVSAVKMLELAAEFPNDPIFQNPPQIEPGELYRYNLKKNTIEKV